MEENNLEYLDWPDFFLFIIFFRTLLPVSTFSPFLRSQVNSPSSLFSDISISGVYQGLSAPSSSSWPH